LTALADSNLTKQVNAANSILNSLANGKLSHLLVADPNISAEEYRIEMMTHLDILLNTYLNDSDKSVPTGVRSIIDKLWIASDGKFLV
jgi:hypothetical protein